MSRSERAILLFLLAMCAGASDGWSFLGFGEVFVANMTGNMVLMGISIFRPHSNLLHTKALLSGQVVHPALALAAYSVGVAIASYVTGKKAQAQPKVARPVEKLIWTRSVTLVLVVETVLALGAEMAWYANRGGAEIPPDALMAVMAMCMGLQSGAMLQLRVPGVVTTYITGTLTQMVQGVTRLVAGEKLEVSSQKAVYEEQLEVQAVTLAVYLLSAILTGWLFQEAPKWVGMLPVACLATVSIWSLLRGGAYSVEK
ncbi:MAG: YoaK family protein [Acidobacteriaceae bacterium]